MLKNFLASFICGFFMLTITRLQFFAYEMKKMPTYNKSFPKYFIQHYQEGRGHDAKTI